MIISAPNVLLESCLVGLTSLHRAKLLKKSRCIINVGSLCVSPIHWPCDQQRLVGTSEDQILVLLSSLNSSSNRIKRATNLVKLADKQKIMSCSFVITIHISHVFQVLIPPTFMTIITPLLLGHWLLYQSSVAITNNIGNASGAC